jgi:hypothetical protein
MQLTLITVNYNNADATIGLLRSLEKQLNSGLDVMVVDNDSAEADRAKLGEYAINSPLRLDIIYSETNRGFSGGNNLAIRKALTQKVEWILLINNDTTVESDFIERLSAQLTNEPCVAGVPLNEGDRVAYGGIVQWLKPTLKHQYGSGDASYAIGAGMLIHRDIFERIGLLDENYFLYFEDADFCMRARQAGIPIRFLREPVIAHRESETTKKLGSSLLLRYHARNALRFNWRNGPWWVRIAVPFAVLYGIIITKNRSMRAGILDFVFGRFGKIDNRIHVGIECESIEDQSWGIARIITRLLENLSEQSELSSQYCFDLYFKSHVPDLPFLKNPMFTCHIVGVSSFSFYYYVLLPIKLWINPPQAMFYANYMMPIIHPPYVRSLTLTTDDMYYEARGTLPLQYRMAYLIFGTWAAKFSTKLLTISETAKTELVRLFRISPERIEVAHLATDTPKQTGNNCYGDYILYVAQAFPRRHLRETIHAFEKISNRFPNLKFIAIGPDKYNPSLEINNDRIIRKERVSESELANLYAHAKVFIYVSDREAFGLPPLEALSYGVPSVLADKPISHELFGNNAFFVAQPNSSDSIASAIVDALINEPKRHAIRTSAPEILAKFTWQNFTTRWLEIVRGMIYMKQ